MTTPNFSQLKRHDINPRKQRVYTFFEIEGEPSLLVRVVGEKNRPLFNRIQKRAGGASRTKLNSAQLQAKARRNARELFAGPDGCIDDWPTPPVDSSGMPVEFTVENCTAFLEALPNHLLDDLMAFVADPSNFTEDDEITPQAAEDLAGN